MRLQGKYIAVQQGGGFFKVLNQKGDFLFCENPRRNTCTIVTRNRGLVVHEPEDIDPYWDLEPGTVVLFKDGTEQIIGPGVMNFKASWHFQDARGRTRRIYDVAGIEKDEWE